MANSPVKLCTCPVDPIVPSIPSTVCTESFGQVLKFGLANKTTQNFEDTVNGITDQASWTAALAAVDTTKVQLTPILSDVLLAANSPINVGGDDNTTPDGVPVLRARTSAQGTAILRDITAAVKVALQEYECLAGSDNIGGIYPMGRDFILAVVDTTGLNDVYKPIPLTYFFVGDKGLGGITETNNNNLEFRLPPNWDNNVVVVPITTFDPIELQNP